MPNRWRAIMSVSTMSSAPRLVANAAGRCSIATLCSRMSAASILGSRSGATPTSSPAAEQRLRLRRGGLVGVGEVAERAQHRLRVLALAQLEGVEAALFHRMQVVPRHFADGAKFALVAEALAQQAPER